MMIKSKRTSMIGGALALLVLVACDAPVDKAAVAQEAAPPATSTAPLREPDVIYVPTPQPVVDAMLAMAGVKKGDVLYDLGSGDGRIPITAAKQFGVRGVGIDINPERIAEANANARAQGVTGLVTFKNEDLFETNFSEASVVTLYLLNSLNEKLRPKLLRDLKPGTRIVSHAFRMGDWEPERTQNVDGSMIYMWTVPAR
jgi:precorrin-6B methylase 2